MEVVDWIQERTGGRRQSTMVKGAEKWASAEGEGVRERLLCSCRSCSSSFMNRLTISAPPKGALMISETCPPGCCPRTQG